MKPRTTHRPLHLIAQEIITDWRKVHYTAAPYVQAMSSLNTIKDRCSCDSGESIVLYFLSNASLWKGEVARRIKLELKQIVKKE